MPEIRALPDHDPPRRQAFRVVAHNAPPGPPGRRSPPARSPNAVAKQAGYPGLIFNAYWLGF
jgi:hypothetical protein